MPGVTDLATQLARAFASSGNPTGPRGVWTDMRGLAVAVLCTALAACSAPLPSSSLTTPPSPTAAVPSASPPTGAVYADGIPSVIDGAPVLRPAAALAHAAAATDATPFLLGGWERPTAPLACLAQPQHVLALSGCDRPFLAEASGTEFDQRLGITGTTQVLLAALPDSLELQSYAPVVVVVHVHDARCTPGDARCLAAFVVDRLAWSDDIPATIDGQPVLSIRQGVTQAATASTSQAFLIGGWFAGFGLTCAAPPADTPMSSLVPWCDGVLLTDLPYEVIVALHDTQAAGHPADLPARCISPSPAAVRPGGLSRSCPRSLRGRLSRLAAGAMPDRRRGRCPRLAGPSADHAGRLRADAEPDRRCPVMRAMQAVAAGLVCLALLACTATRTPSPQRPNLGVSNGTTLAVTLVVNGQRVAVFPPGGPEPSMDLTALPPLPWSVQALSPSGRVLTSMQVQPGEIEGPNSAVHTIPMGRVDLSCGRITIWAGDYPPSGPAPMGSPGTPGDCAP